MTNKKCDKRQKKGDMTDTMTNKKEDKGDTMTNKKGTEGRQDGHSDQQEVKQDWRQREIRRETRPTQ